MLKHVFVVVVIVSAVGFLYGIYNISLEVEPNACQMTYMFERPQFSRIYLSEHANFHYYGLYYYNEGRTPMDVNKLHLKGAPVIFVPGNRGSYKQVRSLASVALKKGRESATGIHLDYYTVDFQEELSALYGNYLERQTSYLKACIEAVLKLYTNNEKSERKVIIIGHSMGAVIAHAVLRDVEISKHINTIISLSAPLKKPLLILDEKIDAFYNDINEYMSKRRSSFKPNNNTNFCSTSFSRRLLNNHSDYIDPVLKNVLLISIGGGNRDLLVQPGLTISKYSDIHAMTMSIPKVWISCDHLSAVWCLQLVLVINRYMFDISTRKNYNYVYFIKDRILREQVALNHFAKANRLLPKEINIEQKATNNTIWREDSRKTFSRGFKEGLTRNFIQLISLWKHAQYQKLYIDIIQLDYGDFLFGCSVKSSVNESMFCKDGISLSHHFQTLPSFKNQLRSVAILDIDNLRNTYLNWSHIGLFIHATRTPKVYNIDIHIPKERYIYLKVPRWSTLQETSLVNESAQGTLYYKLLIQGLEETYPTIELRIEPLTCMGELNPIIIKMCIPWAPGFTKYQILRDPSAESFYANVPVSSPIGYNSTSNPISLEIYLDPFCRYHISYKFSIAGTMSKIVQQFYHWLPSHLTTVILIILKNQIWEFHDESNTKSVRPFYGYFQFASLYIITGCRILSKLLTSNESIDPVRGLSFYLVVIIHSTAIVLSILAVFLIWILIIVTANGLLRISNWCFLNSVPMTDNFLALFGAFIILVAINTCGGLALLVTCVLYLLLISNAYKDYIDNWILKTGISLHKKVRCFYKNRSFGNVSYERNNHMSLIRCEGMNNFSFHIALLILLCIMTALNFMTLVDWMKDPSIVRHGKDSSVVPPLIVMSSLSILWLLKAPRKISSFGIGYKAVSSLLYISASGCIIYCQEALYQLNFIIAFVFVLFAAQELLGQSWSALVFAIRKNK